MHSSSSRMCPGGGGRWGVRSMTFPSWWGWAVNDLSFLGGVGVGGQWPFLPGVGGWGGGGPVKGRGWMSPPPWTGPPPPQPDHPQGQTTSPCDHVTYPMMHLVSSPPPDLDRVSGTCLWKHNLCLLHYVGSKKVPSILKTLVFCVNFVWANCSVFDSVWMCSYLSISVFSELTRINSVIGKIRVFIPYLCNLARYSLFGRIPVSIKIKIHNVF